MLRLPPVIASDIVANGATSGSDSMMMNGLSHDSNCAASTRYMKMTARPIASTKALLSFAISLLWPNGNAE
jgi:hypothetical protein